MILLTSQSHGGMPPISGVLEWRDTASLGKDRQGRPGQGVNLYVNEHLYLPAAPSGEG